MFINSLTPKVNLLHLISTEDPIIEEHSLLTLKEQSAYYFQATKCIFNFLNYFYFLLEVQLFYSTVLVSGIGTAIQMHIFFI